MGCPCAYTAEGRGGGGQEEEESKTLKAHNSHPQGILGSVHLLLHLWITSAALMLEPPTSLFRFLLNVGIHSKGGTFSKVSLTHMESHCITSVILRGVIPSHPFVCKCVPCNMWTGKGEADLF